jgi:hypothetical protein
VVDTADVLGITEEHEIAHVMDEVTGYRIFVVTTTAASGSLEDDLHALGGRAAWDGTDWAADAVVLALGVQSREIGICYGAMAYDVVDPASDDIYDAMAAEFRSSNWAVGFLDGIKTVYQAITYGPRSTGVEQGDTDDGDDDAGYSDGSSTSGSSGSSGWLILLVVLVVSSLLWRLVRRGGGDWESDGSGDSGDDGSWGGSSWGSRRRWGGSRSGGSGGWFGGGSGRSGGRSSGRSFGGSSRRSSGGSSRRSFGGSSHRSSGGSSHRSSRGGGGSRHF